MAGYELSWYLRPIEWINATMGGYTLGGAESIDDGVYANVLVLARQITKQSGTNYQVRVVQGSDLRPRIKIYHAAAANFTINFAGSLFGAALGFTGTNYTGASTYTSEACPLASWCPGRVRIDQEHWRRELSDAQRGSESRSGAVSFSRYATTVYRSEHRYEAIPDDLIFAAANANAFEENSSLEQFVEDSRISWPSVATYPSPCGCWYIPDYQALPLDANGYYCPDGTSGGDVGWLVDHEGVEYFLTTDPDIVTFCHLDADWYPQPGPWLPYERSYYAVNLRLHTATAPSGFATAVDPPA